MDSLSNLERELLTSLADRLSNCPAPDSRYALGEVDTSLLSSAWQKAIRRSDRDIALRCAAELLRRDADYVWRRIRIIALEDVSVGHTELVATVLAVAGKRALQRALGEQRLLALLVSDLCAAPKSRTACDLAVLLPEHVIDEPCPALEVTPHFDRGLLYLQASAWRNTASYSAHEAGRWRTINHGNRRLRDRYLDQIEAPPAVRFIALRGSGTEGLNVLLPLVHQLQTLKFEPVVEGSSPRSSWHRVGALSAYAFCMYSGPGTLAITEFLKQTEWGNRLRALGVRNLRKAFGYLLFYVEGGYLSRQWEVKHGGLIRAWSEEVALGRFGIAPERVETLKSEVQSDLPQLNAFRRKIGTGGVS